jgi:hypothetical protein
MITTITTITINSMGSPQPERGTIPVGSITPG